MMDFCKIIQAIEKDPTAIVPIKTIRDLLLLRAHVASCQPCSDSAERVNRRHDAPPENGVVIGLN